MSVCDVVEEVVEDRSERSVNSAQSTSEPCPLGLVEVRHVDICVLQVCNQDEMIVDDKVGYEVEAGEGSQAKGVDEPSKKGEVENQAQV